MVGKNGEDEMRSTHALTLDSTTNSGLSGVYGLYGLCCTKI